MRIELEEPFKSCCRPYGSIWVLKNGRKNVSMTKLDGTQTNFLYSRYLMCVKLGYILPSDIHVDHIDDDKTNDDIDNLQLLTPVENILKYKKYYNENIKQTYKHTCVYCSVIFEVAENRHNNKNTKYCSKKCVSLSQQISKDVITEINNLAITNTNESIARLLNLDSTTVAKYRTVPLSDGSGVKLSEDKINQINELAKTGISDLEISRLLNVSPTGVNINRIVPSSTNRGRKTPIDVQLQIKTLVSIGKSIEEIIEETKLSKSTIKKYMEV